MNSESPY